MERIPPTKGKKVQRKPPASVPKKKKNKNKVGKKGIGLPYLPISLQKELGSIHQQKNEDEDDDRLSGDDYEYEEGLAEEETGKNRRYDRVDKLEYELPSDFEDEEIDEDTAFGDEQPDQSEEAIADKGMARESHLARQLYGVDLNNGQEDDMGEYHELSGEDEDESNDDLEAGVKHEVNVVRKQVGDQSGDDNDEEEKDGKEDGERHQRMLQDVIGMSSDAFEGKKRRKKLVISETYPESEYNLDIKATGTNESVSIEDLMAPLYGKSGFGSLRKRMQQLEKKAIPLAAPLPKAVQERLERKAAYEKTKEDVAKWQPLVKKNREAPTVNFAKRPHVGKATTGAIAYDFEPTTSLEKEIATLLQDTRVAEAQERDGVELLELNKLTVEQVREQQGRLAKMRSLLFRHELKAKHIKKIKSKTFHRLLKKDRQKRGSGEVPSDPEAAKEYAMKQEFKRAQERMTLKHKNTSKWAKRVLKRGLRTQDEGTRAAVAEQLRLNTLLTQKIHSMNEGSDSGESSSEEDDCAVISSSSENEHKSKVLAKAKEETLKVLGAKEEEMPKSGLLSLPFMVRGIEKRNKQVQDEAAAALKEYEYELRSENDDVKVGKESKVVTRGRLVFGELNRQTGRIGASQVAKIESDDMLLDKGSGSEDDCEDQRDQNSVQESNLASVREQMEIDPHIALEQANIVPDGLHKVMKTAGPLSVGNDLKIDFEEEIIVPGSTKNISLAVCNSRPWLFGDSDGKTNEKIQNESTCVKVMRDKNKNKRSKSANKQWPTADGDPTEIQNESTGGDSDVKTAERIQNERTSMTAVQTKGKQKKSKPANEQQPSMADVEEPKVRTKPTVSIAGAVRADLEKISSQNSGEVLEIATSKRDSSAIHLQKVDEPELHHGDEAEMKQRVPSEGMELLDGIHSQADLIQLAFAGDDVEAEFEQEKAKALNEEAPPSEEVVSLPGWGQWTDIQQKKGLPGWILQEREKEKMKREEALRKRKDAKLKYVIISEKEDKKAEKFYTSSLPFPYKSREVFDRSMRMPLGPEFNTAKAFQDLIRPPVIKKAGVIIDPIKYEKHEPQEKNLESPPKPAKRKRLNKGQDLARTNMKLKGMSKKA